MIRVEIFTFKSMRMRRKLESRKPFPRASRSSRLQSAGSVTQGGPHVLNAPNSMRLRRTGISGLAIAITLICTIVASQARPAVATAQVRLAVLKFGTVSWVLDVIKHHGLDRDLGFELIVTPYAGTQATKVALQAGAADIIVSDWLWVSRRRRSGTDLVFHPYSTAVGAIMVPATSTIRSCRSQRKSHRRCRRTAR